MVGRQGEGVLGDDAGDLEEEGVQILGLRARRPGQFHDAHVGPAGKDQILHRRLVWAVRTPLQHPAEQQGALGQPDRVVARRELGVLSDLFADFVHLGVRIAEDGPAVRAGQSLAPSGRCRADRCAHLYVSSFQPPLPIRTFTM